MSDILETHINRGGGVIAGPQGLGILVGSDPTQCPKGWIFVDVDSAKMWTPQQRRECLDRLKAGRNRWPEKRTASDGGGAF